MPKSSTKYAEGHEFANHKRLVSYEGSHPKWRTSTWIWECTKCLKRRGPSLINSITRMDRKPQCCFNPGAAQLKGKRSAKWTGYEDISGTYLRSLENGAKSRNIEYAVSGQQLWEKWLSQDGRCAYSNLKLTHGANASVDRIDSNYGYVLGNVQWVHKHINTMKWNLPEVVFLGLCRSIIEHSGHKTMPEYYEMLPDGTKLDLLDKQS